MVKKRTKTYRILLEQIHGKSYHDILVKMYVEDDMSIREMSKILKIGIGTIHRDLKEEGINKQLTWK